MRANFVFLLVIAVSACETPNPCAEGRYDPGPPRACVLEDGRVVLLDDAGARPDGAVPDDASPPLDAAVLDDASGCDLETLFYRDADGDGRGAPGASTSGCTAPTGYVADNTDCDDDCADCYPGATEICDGRDGDCDDAIDEGAMTTFYVDADEDGHGSTAMTTIACAAPAGFVAVGDDCDDACSTCHPANTEETHCDGLDDDCDMALDEGVMTTWYRDCDHDGFGQPSAFDAPRCARPTLAPIGCPDGSWTTLEPVGTDLDCADREPRAFPGQTEYFDTAISGPHAGPDFDFDCDGVETQSWDTGRCVPDPITAYVCTNGWARSEFLPNVACGVSERYRTCTSPSTCPGAIADRVQACG